MATAVYTVGEDGVFHNCFAFGVTESINVHGIARTLGVTNGTVNHSVIATAVYTVGEDGVFHNCFAFGVTESINVHGIARTLGVTNGTVNHSVIATAIYTVGGDSIFYNSRTVGMSCSGNYNCFGVENFVTSYTTLYVVVAAFFFTSSGNFVLSVKSAFLMTESRIGNIVAFEHLATNLTVNYVVVATFFFTSRGDDIFANRISGGVTESANSCIYIGVTARTGVSGKTTVGTCGCGNNAGVSMLSRRYYMSACELVAVIVYSYYFEGIFYLRLTVSGNLEITDAVVLCKRVGNVFIIAIYSVLNSAFYLVPGELYLSAFLVGSGYCDGQLTFAGQSVDALSTCGKSHGAGESNYESKYGYERAKLSE